MQDQRLPILIFAHSGRFMAQSATQAGYRVWVADCFGDQDTLDIAERWQQLVPIAQLSEKRILRVLSTLSQGENCLLICGSGIEQHYPLLNNLPANITLLGNSASSIHAVRTPTLFFKLLNQLEISYPDTLFKPPSGNEWLAKSFSGLGGIHIQYLKNHHQADKCYYQRYVVGKSGSGLFVANGKKAQLLSINQHYLQPSESSPFRLGSITTPWMNAKPHQKQLELAINKVALKAGLRGFNSIDFIISDQDQLLILEINPRISASAELLNNQLPIFQYHIDACNGFLTDIIIESAAATLSYLYADSDVISPVNMDWPEKCHDIPRAGEVIAMDDPICSLTFHGKTTGSFQQQFKQARQQIISQLRGEDY